MLQKIKGASFAMFAGLLAVIATAGFAPDAHAQIDASALVDGIELAETAIQAVVGAALLVLAVLIGWKYLKRAGSA